MGRKTKKRAQKTSAFAQLLEYAAFLSTRNLRLRGWLDVKRVQIHDFCLHFDKITRKLLRAASAVYASTMIKSLQLNHKDKKDGATIRS